MKDNDAVGPEYGVESVRDGDYSPAQGEAVHRFLQEGFVFRI